MTQFIDSRCFYQLWKRNKKKETQKPTLKGFLGRFRALSPHFPRTFLAIFAHFPRMHKQKEEDKHASKNERDMKNVCAGCIVFLHAERSSTHSSFPFPYHLLPYGYGCGAVADRLRFRFSSGTAPVQLQFSVGSGIHLLVTFANPCFSFHTEDTTDIY